MTTKTILRLGSAACALAVLALATVSRVGAQTVFFSDNYNRPNLAFDASKNNLDLSTNGMGGVLITSNILVPQGIWNAPCNIAYNSGSNDMIAVNSQVRMGGFGHTTYIFPNYNFAGLVSTGIVSVITTFTNNGPSGSSTVTYDYDRYEGIGVGFGITAGNANGATDRWMQTTNDLFVDETETGTILIYDGAASGRGGGANPNGNYNLAVPLGGAGGAFVTGTLRIDLMITNTTAGSPVHYNVLWNPASNTGYTNVATGRSFNWSGNNAFCVGVEERSAQAVTNIDFTVESSSYTMPPNTSLVWRATVNNTWDTTTVNWVDGILGLTSYAFFTGANVTFNDVTSNSLVNVPGTVLPGTMLVNNVNSNYTFFGTGSIGGAGSLSLSGPGTLTMDLSNTFTNGTSISGGTLRVGNNNALGTGTLTLSGGVLSSDGTTARTLPNAVVVAGTATIGDLNSNGVVTLNGTVNLNGGDQTLTINSPAVFAGGASNGALGIKQGPGTLTINGPVNYNSTEDVYSGTLIYNGATVNTSARLIADASANSAARLAITNGASVINTGTTSNLRSGRAGAATGSNYVDLAGLYSIPEADSADGYATLYGTCAYSEMTFLPGGDFTARGVTNYLGMGNTVFKFNGGILRSANPTAFFFQGISNALVQAGGANIDDGGFAITINQNLVGDTTSSGGGLNKIGAGSLTLAGVNTYTGNTIISNGALSVSGSLAGNGTVTVMSAGTLSGSGSVAGPVVVQSGGTVAPGAVSGVPTTLTLQGSLTLSGNLLVQVNESLSPSNDLIVVNGVLTNAGAGTLTLNNPGSYFGGNSFKLFNKPLPNGNALSLSPARPGQNQVWTNRLAIDGTIGVLASTNTAANLANLTLSAGTLSPAFNSNILSYAATVAYSNATVAVTPVTANAGATIQVISLGVTNAVASGSPSSPIALNPGKNLIDVRVTSPDASLVNDYFVNLTRTPPNVIVILADDQGYSDWHYMGSEISTPNLDYLASTGLKFRNFYNAARCSPTRIAIMTGLYTQQAATDPSASLPPLRTDNNVTIAEVLGAAGYHTYMAGKWHLGASTGQLPWQRGYDEVFTYASGTAADEDEWTPSDYMFDSVDGETTNITYASGAFYQPDVIGDYCIQFLGNQFTRHTNSPFFMYIPFGSAHFPIQAPEPWVTTNLPIYAQGWDVLRWQRYTNMLALGVIDPRYALSPNEGAPDNSTIGAPGVEIPAWSTLNTNYQAHLTRSMAIYESMIQKMDANIGRVIQYLQQNGQFDNTIIFACSDNGANYEGGVFGSVGGTSGEILTGANLLNMGLAGQPQIQLGGSWAHVSNTPFRLYKHFDHFGGIGTPGIIHWPQGLSRTNQWENQSAHVMDIMATIVDVTGATYPTHWTNSAIGTGYAVLPLAGQSLKPLFNSSTSSVPRNIGFEHEGNRAYISGNWKFVTKNFSLFDGSSFANQLELYNLTNDPTEMTNLAYVDLSWLAQMGTNWNNWCNFVGDASSLLLTAFTNPSAPVYPALYPAPLTNDLFVDSFDRGNNSVVDAAGFGMSGSYYTVISPPIGVNATYYAGYQGSGTGTSIQIVSNSLWMANGGGTAENGLEYNFDGPDIAAAGGFSVEVNVQKINDNGTDTSNKYVGFGVGLTQAQAAGGADISQPGSFRGEAGATNGVSAFFVDLNYNGNIEVWTNGVLLNTISVGESSGVLTASFACAGFTTNNPVVANVFYNGQLVNINPSGPNTTGLTFYWNTNYNNYLGLSARASNYAQMDNLAIRKLPLVNDLVADYAMGFGLSGTNAAPTADPDGDGVDNFGEWAFGGNPTVPDSYIASLQNIQVLPGNDFRFTYQRYINYAAVGLQYHYLISTDLVNWTEVTPTILSADVNEDNTDYEVVTLELPTAITATQNNLYLRIYAAAN